MMTEIKLRLNPLFRIQLSNQPDNTIIIELFLEEKSLKINDVNFLKIISFAKEGTNIFELSSFISKEFDLKIEEAEKIVFDLIEKKFLVTNEYKKEEMESVRHWVERGWLDALILHLSIKNMTYADDNVENLHDENDKYFKELLKKERFPSIFKKYPNYPLIKLPDPLPLPQDRSFEEILLSRRSHRPWSNNVFQLEELSTILKNASYETKRLRDLVQENIEKKPSVLMNASFSALEIYFFSHDVEGIKNGLYFYDLKEHGIVLLKKGDFREAVAKMCIGQKSAGSGAITFIISCLWNRYMFRYRHPMGYRTILINTSELAQKLLILCTAFGKSTFLTPAFNDEQAEKLLDVFNLEEAPLYVVAAG
ncbi:SagB/ThcOx family dehydrogenase [Bacillus gobiensis]|uniref:SagB/ThcOx family dehydrogenase n=1 Tax=Bacillus gobiensis TaxID=1441095 RepID=UPI003D215054